MKKRTLTLSLILLFVMTLGGCDTQQHNAGKLLTLDEIKQIAQDHNEGLDYVLNSLKEKNKMLKAKNFSHLKETIDSELKEFFSMKFSSSEVYKNATTEEIEEVVNKTITSMYGDKTKELVIKSGNQTVLDIVLQISPNLSDDLVKQLTKIDNTFANENNSNDEILLELENIANQAQDDLTPEDMQIIFVATEIGKASLSYWKNKLPEWVNALSLGTSNKDVKTLLSYQMATTCPSCSVAKHDLAGGVSAGVGAALVNAIPGAGQVAYGSAILGGAAVASTYEATIQVLNWFFGE